MFLGEALQDIGEEEEKIIKMIAKPTTTVAQGDDKIRSTWQVGINSSAHVGRKIIFSNNGYLLLRHGVCFLPLSIANRVHEKLCAWSLAENAV